MTLPTGTHTQAVPEYWTVLSLVQWSTAYLEEKGFEEARLHTELLLGHVLGLDRLKLYLQFDRPLTPDELSSFKELFKRRLGHEPLQYILGEMEFMGIRLAVAPGALIPRPETELLVEKVVEHIRALNREGVSVLDIGTGSGNIALAIAHMVPACRVTSIDVSKEALSIARGNQERLRLQNVILEERDVREGARTGEKYDVIVSNPPYVSSEDFKNLQPEVRDHEPRLALTDEGNGLSFYPTLFQFAAGVLGADGRSFCEIGYGQAEAVSRIASTEGIQVLDIVSDLAGIPRVLCGTVSS
jgi:release factor glutamine methyltransferase